MPERTFSSPDYRYGFNGKEKDEDEEWGSAIYIDPDTGEEMENSLTHYDYGFRIYNPGIGRFLSVDPLTREYPFYTPYQFAANTPIIAIDLDGLEQVFRINSRTVGNEFEAALDNGDIYDGKSAMKWLSNNNHRGMYPNGVLQKPWANDKDYEWLKEKRANGIFIPNVVAELDYDMTKDYTEAAWLVDIVDKDGRIGVKYKIVRFRINSDGEREKISGGLVIYGDGEMDFTIDPPGTEAGGSYGSMDWGDDLSGGGSGFSNNRILRMIKWAVGTLGRADKLTDTDPNRGGDDVSPDITESPMELVSESFDEEMRFTEPADGKSIDTIEIGVRKFSNGTRDSTAPVLLIREAYDKPDATNAWGKTTIIKDEKN